MKLITLLFLVSSLSAFSFECKFIKSGYWQEPVHIQLDGYWVNDVIHLLNDKGEKVASTSTYEKCYAKAFSCKKNEKVEIIRTGMVQVDQGGGVVRKTLINYQLVDVDGVVYETFLPNYDYLVINRAWRDCRASREELIEENL